MKEGHTYVQWITAFVAEMTLLSNGLQAGWISPSTEFLQSPSSPAGRPLTDLEISWIASVMPLAGTIGVPLFVYLADNHGRKIGVLVMATMQSMCWIVKLSHTSFISLLISNIFAGVAAGGCFQLIPVYVKEISQENIRETLVVMFLLMQNIGILTMFAIGAYLDYFTVLWIVLAISLVVVAALFKAPESPAYLVKLGKYEEAAATVAFLRGFNMEDKVVQGELDSMKDDDRQFKTLPDVTILSILRNKLSRKGLLLLIVVFTTQSFNGNFVIFTYALPIISASGVTLSPELQTLSIPIVMILGSFANMSCVDKIGRKIIMAAMYALSTVALVALGIALRIQQQGGSFPGWVPIVAIAVSVFAYAAGISAMPYVIMSDIFNFQIRTKVAGCLVTYAFFIVFLQAMVFAQATAFLGLDNTMYGFAAINFIGLVVAVVVLPETRGKSLDEIERILMKK